VNLVKLGVFVLQQQQQGHKLQKQQQQQQTNITYVNPTDLFAPEGPCDGELKK
jgi:hypothetical protein